MTYERNSYYASMTDEQLEQEFLALEIWDMDLCNELSYRAGMTDEWREAEDIEPIIYEMADKAGIKVI